MRRDIDTAIDDAAGQSWRDGGFGLYVHWPFCASKCPYCDFNSHVAATIDHARWARAYEAEIARVAARTAGAAGGSTGARVLQTIFFGGGTPSLMAPETVAAAIGAARRAWPAANDLEVTLEANPGSVEAGRFAAYREAGVNRVSLGVQALRDGDLQRLGRRHTVREALAALDLARRAFERVSIDLIYARQDQTAGDWHAELAEALRLGLDHLSLYQLTVEPGTPFAARQAAGGLRGLPDDDSAADLYAMTQEMCGAAGLPAYEVSNHAGAGAESRHNLVYWRSGDWAAVGPGAHGRLTLDGRRVATEARRSPLEWLAAAEAGVGAETEEVLAPQEQVAEAVMMGLRLAEGVDLARIGTAGMDLEKLNYLKDMGLIWRTGSRLGLTAQGRPVLDAVLRELLAD